MDAFAHCEDLVREADKDRFLATLFAPAEARRDLLEAHRFDFYDEMFATRADLETYADQTVSAVIELALRILGAPAPGHRELAQSAGIAYGIIRLARSFAFHASRGKIFIPEEILAARGVARGDILAGRSSDALRAALADFRSQARSYLDAIRDALTDLPDRFVDALLPVALLRPYLARMERSDYDPFRTAVEVPQWRKQWR